MCVCDTMFVSVFVCVHVPCVYVSLRVYICVMFCMQILHVSREVGIKDSQVPLLGKIAASDSPSHTDMYLHLLLA